LRSTLADKQNTYNKELAKLAKETFESGTLEGNLLVLGEQYRGDILAKMNEGIPAPTTGKIAYLVDSGQLRSSLTAVVRDLATIEEEGAE
jgi:hypothetical protein